MSMKRVVGAAAVAAGLGISAITLNPGIAYSDPTPPPGPTSHGGPGGGGGAPQSPPQPHEPPSTQATQPPATHSTQPPAPQSTEAPAPHSTEPPAPHSTQPPAQSTEAPAPHSTEPPKNEPSGSPSGEPTTPPSGHEGTTPPSEHEGTTPGGHPTGAPSTEVRPVLHPPSTQPPHPPYIPPRGDIARGSVEIGGPVDITVGFSIPGRGAPPPPPQRGHGWNDGPAPGHPPPNWEGPPPQGGWDGPPPPGGWNRPWGGPPRDVVYAQRDFGPFAYNTFTVIPVFNWMYGGWGYWFFGLWIPLY
jgi:hypothetical protein